MNPPDNKNLSDDDYLDAGFESDLSDIEDDLPSDSDSFDEEELFANPPAKKSKKKILLGLLLVTALAAGGGLFLLGGTNDVATPAVDLAPQQIPEAATAPAVPEIPGIPVPASDFDTAELSSGAPPVVPVEQNIPVPADIPSVPENEQSSVQDTSTAEQAPPTIPTTEIPNADTANTEIPPADLPVSSESGISDATSLPEVKNEPINLDTVGETSVEAPVKTAENIATVEKKEKDDFQKMVDRAQTIKPETKKNKPQVEYFDSPKGESVRDLPPPAINPFTEPGQNLIIVNRNPTAGAVIERSDNSAYVEAKLVSANRASALGKHEAALDFYNEIYKENARDPRILMGRAVTYQKLGENEKAIEDYYAVLEVQPDNPEALTNLMGLIVKTKPAVALENLLNLRERFPRNASVAAQLGVAYAQSGNSQDGLKYLQLAANLEPDNAQHYFNMAVISEHLGDKAAAISHYEKALDLSAVYGVKSGSPFTREQIYDRLSRLRGA